MATRPIFVPLREGRLLVRQRDVEFVWFPGLSVAQKRKSVASLHQAAKAADYCQRPLEISTKSEHELGVALSAFNLEGQLPDSKRRLPLECIFQSSKVFEGGGPYRDLLDLSPREAKRDARLRGSGRLVAFDYFGEVWPLEPRTAFYDWLYGRALHDNADLIRDAGAYDAFTDIEFNPEKALNCQARSLAQHIAFGVRGVSEGFLANRAAYLLAIEAR